VSTAIEAVAVGKRYGRKWALRDSTLTVPAGRVVGLVGPNGAGKSTLLNLAVGLSQPTEGHITVLGGRPGCDAGQLAKVGFLAQDVPLYNGLTVGDHLRFGARLNPGWDPALARDRIARVGLDHSQRAAGLSGGQRAQLALAVAVGKRPELLILDEPVASLDPLARREFLADLMQLAADGLSIVLSSHLLSDMERVCDYLIVLAAGRVQLAGDVDILLAAHKLLVGARRDPSRLPADQTVIQQSHTDRQSTLLIHTTKPVLDPSWTVHDVGLEDLVLAYMAASPAYAGHESAPNLRSVG
jgi:ABC-2 type transport system ATP-binding protein